MTTQKNSFKLIENKFMSEVVGMVSISQDRVIHQRSLCIVEIYNERRLKKIKKKWAFRREKPQNTQNRQILKYTYTYSILILY